MLHGKRAHNIKTYTDLVEMATAMKRCTWTLCTGFRFGNVLLLNDSTSEDALQEYAVALVEPDGSGQFVESYTISWMEIDRLVKLVRELNDAVGQVRPSTYGTYKPRDHQEECQLCA